MYVPLKGSREWKRFIANTGGEASGKSVFWEIPEVKEGTNAPAQAGGSPRIPACRGEPKQTGERTHIRMVDVEVVG